MAPTDDPIPSPTTPPATPIVRRSETWRARYGPWAVVTGASNGIGREIARRCAEAGLNVALVARGRQSLDDVAAEARRAGVDARVLALDLGRPGAGAELVESVADLELGLVVLAAGFGTSGPLVEGDLEAELAMVDVNCRAVAEASWRLGRRLVKRGRGGLVLLSSIVAFQGTPHAAHYAATKAYVQTLAEGLRPEMARRGVDVLAAAPGPVHSGFAARAGMTMGKALTPRQVANGILDALAGGGTARPGWLSKVLGYSLATLPRPVRSRVIGQVMRSMIGTPDGGRAIERTS